MSLTRQHQILQAIIEDYVSLREPVGSKALVERHQLGVSSATVRNEMMALEEQGLIQAPHSSAGRIPTAKGYRFFVDEIAKPRPLKPAEKKAIHRFLDSSDSLDQVYEQTVRLLSQLTHQVAVLQLPVATGDSVQHVEIIKTSELTVAVILIDNSGQVHQKIMGLKQPLASAEDAQQKIHSLVKGKSFFEAHQAIAAHNELLSNLSLRSILAGIDDLLLAQQNSRLLISGTSYLANATHDFSQSIAPILEALEEQVTMLQLLNAMVAEEEVTVRIGAETQSQPLSEASIVASAYGTEITRNLGVIGPTRMDYSSTMATVRGVAQYLSRILGT